MVDSSTGRTKVRMVNVDSQSYQIAWQYMIRLTKADMNNGDLLTRYAALVGLSSEAFRERFSAVL
jgi:6-phosphofructokinase 1